VAQHPLIGWLHEQGGATADDVVIRASDSVGNGLSAQNAHAKGSCLVHLPRGCQLTYSTSGPSQDSAALLGAISMIPQSFWGLRLALKVLEQRALGAKSQFAPYIAHLPATVPGLPMFFSRAQSTVLNAAQYFANCRQTGE
jgi:hypothetical protein